MLLGEHIIRRTCYQEKILVVTLIIKNHANFYRYYQRSFFMEHGRKNMVLTVTKEHVTEEEHVTSTITTTLIIKNHALYRYLQQRSFLDHGKKNTWVTSSSSVGEHVTKEHVTRRTCYQENILVVTFIIKIHAISLPLQQSSNGRFMEHVTRRTWNQKTCYQENILVVTKNHYILLLL